MFFPTASIPADSADESVRSSISLVILSDIETLLTVVPTVAPEISPEAKVAVVALPVDVLGLVVHSDSETEPSEAPPSPDHAPVSPVHAPILPDDHPVANTEYEPFEDKSEHPSKGDA
ncbi:hypothetical protein Tco_1512908 [Tanacetum coccineum]